MFKFDTRKTKPHLWYAGIFSMVVWILVVFLYFFGPDQNAMMINGILVIYFLILFIELVRTWKKQLEYNPYSYNTIVYIGFALFVFSIFLTHAILMIAMIRNPELYQGLTVLDALLTSAQRYLLLSFPLILFISIGLCISNICLIMREGWRFVNTLGILFSLAFLIGALLIFWTNYYFSGSQREVMLHEIWTNSLAAIYLYFECMFIGSIIANTIVPKYKPPLDRDFMIILGCGLRPDGTPTRLLKSRVDKALEFYHKQKDTTGKDLIFIPSGGQGIDEVMPESTSMKNYLMSQGIPEESIVEENQSTNTFTNMLYSKKIIDEINPEGKVAFSTNLFHLFRSGVKARRVKMKAVGVGSETEWYYWPNASIRELIGLLSEHRGKQALILISLIIIYTWMSVLVYR